MRAVVFGTQQTGSSHRSFTDVLEESYEKCTPSASFSKMQLVSKIRDGVIGKNQVSWRKQPPAKPSRACYISTTSILFGSAYCVILAVPNALWTKTNGLC
jgi:hypothetical protein